MTRPRIAALAAFAFAAAAAAHAQSDYPTHAITMERFLFRQEWTYA